MKEERKKTILFTVMGLILLAVVLKNSFTKKDLYENLSITEGIVTDYSFNNNNYILKYEYTVNNVVYRSTEVTDFFKCDDGTPGCKGKKFQVEYSSQNPKNSVINLGKYNDKKLISLSF